MAQAPALPSCPLNTTQLSNKIQEDYLMCKICYDRFASTPVERLPKSLSCTHTFCCGCIGDYFSKSKRNKGKTKFPCPLCRRVTWIPKGKPANLPNNYTLLGLLELVQEPQGRPTHRATVAGVPPLQAPVQTSPKKTANTYSGTDNWKLRPDPPTRSPDPPTRPPPFNPEYSSQMPSLYLGESTSSEAITDHVTYRLSKLTPNVSRFHRTKSMYEKRDRGASSTPAHKSSAQLDFPSDLSPIPPIPPPRRIASGVASSISTDSLRCLGHIGRYSDAHMQTGAFMQPSRVAASTTPGQVLVVDGQQMVVQVFDVTDDRCQYISMFKMMGVTGACFLTSNTLAVGTIRGVSVTTIDGQVLKEITLGKVNTTVPYHFGFIAVQSTALHFFSHTYTQYKTITKLKTNFFLSKTFSKLQDVAVNSHQDLVILDTGHRQPVLYIANRKGRLLFTLDPRAEVCGRIVQSESIAVDKWNSILVSDVGNCRVLKFSADGVYAGSVVKLEDSCVGLPLCTLTMSCHGLAISADGCRLYVVFRRTLPSVQAFVSIHQLL